MATCFNARKAAQVAAVFCLKADGNINVLKLVKLIYLADRESMAKSGAPITNDHFVAMKHGPVVSQTYNYIKGEAESDEWSDLIRDRANHMVGLARDLKASDADELSKFELRVLDSIWDQFGAKNQWELVDWTHENCDEWDDPGDTSRTISHERIFKELHSPAPKEQARILSEEQGLLSVLAKK